MIKFIKYLWWEYKKQIKISEIEYRRKKILQRVMKGEESKDIQREWANLNHEQKKLDSYEYRKMCEDIDKKNAERKET